MRAGGPCAQGALHNAGQRPALLGCVAQRGPEARATGVRWYVNAGRRPVRPGYVGTSTRAGGPRTQGTLVRERGPEARATGVRCTTRAGGPRTQGALVRERGPEARAPGCVGT